MPHDLPSQKTAYARFLAHCTPAPLIRVPGPAVRLDLSTNSPVWADNQDYRDLARFTARIDGLLAAAGAAVGYGGYGEVRPVYTTPAFAEPGPDGQPRYRDTHLGLDLWTAAGTPIYAPLSGRVHSRGFDPRPGTYGATLLLEHCPSPTLTFWTLYGHLDRASLGAWSPGDPVAAGAPLARIGHAPDNGGWPPHLHFQVTLDILDYHADYPGVAYPETAATWLARCPDPAPLTGLPPENDGFGGPARSV